MTWTISRSLGRGGYHIQARTDDQMNSFAAIVRGDCYILRTKAIDGSDVFTLTQQDPHVTFNVFGKIRYVNDWDGV